MEYTIYSIFDRVTATYGEPFLAVNNEDSKRKIAYAMRSNPYKEDLCLYVLGTFHAVTGILVPNIQPEFLCNLMECYSEESSNE